VRHIVETAGAEKVLFGSDFGLSDWMIVEDRLDSVRYAGLPEHVLHAVLYGNAARLLKLSPSDWNDGAETSRDREGAV